MENFTPLEALAGGLLIGLSTSLFLLTTGKVLGISGIIENLLTAKKGNIARPAAFLAALVLGAFLVNMTMPHVVPQINVQASMLVVAIAGLLMGFGARIGSGCTSGHGISGMARLSRRSIVATLVFFSMAAVTVYVVRYVPAVTALIQF